jgi:hypothetical protein
VRRITILIAAAQAYFRTPQNAVADGTPGRRACVLGFYTGAMPAQ